MRKISVFALTAATVLAAAGTAPMASYAAANTYSVSGGNGRAIVIGGNNVEGLKAILGQIGNDLDLSGCQTVIPGLNVPGINWPDNSLPLPEFPSQDGTDNLYPEAGQDALADQVVALVNQERAKAGLAPLTVHAGAAGAAQVRAREIESSFSHTRPDGRNYSTALDEAGVGYRSNGENIAYGQRSAEQVMKGWMNSAGHRANILNPGFTSIGVGHYRSQSGVDYWTQLFVN